MREERERERERGGRVGGERGREGRERGDTVREALARPRKRMSLS